MLGRLMLYVASPSVVRSLGDLAGHSMADYSSWALGPLIPPINPEAIAAAEADPPPPTGPGAPQDNVPIAVVGAATPSPAAPSPTPTAEASPTPTNTAAPPVPPTATAAPPSPTATATRTTPPIQAPTLPPPSTSAPTSTSAAPSSTPVTAPDSPPAPPTRTPAPTSSPLPTATSAPFPTTLPTAQPPTVPSPQPSPVPPSPVPPTASPEPTPAVEFASAAVTAGESAGEARVVVRLSRGYSKPVQVPYRVEPGTATSGKDYTIASPAGTLVFNPGAALEQTIQVALIRDGLDELSESFTVQLGEPTNAVLVGANPAVVTIIDGDGPPTVSFAGDGRTLVEGNGPDQSVAVTIQLSGPSALDVTVPYQVRGAAGADDHTLRSGTAIIPAGSSGARLRFAVVGDLIDEDDEQIEIRLGAPTNAQIGSPSLYTVTIVDDDTAAVTIKPTLLSVAERPASAPATYEVVLASRPVADVVITVASPDGQLSAEPATLRFTPESWRTPQRVTVRAVDDKVDEPDQHEARLVHSIASADPRYRDLTDVDPVIVTIADDDTAGVELRPQDGRLTLSESPVAPDHSAAYTLRLTSQPTATVQIDLAPDAQVTVGPAALVFTPATWQTPQTVVVTAVDDRADEDGDDNVTRHRGVVRQTASSTDPAYGGRRAFTIPDVVAQILDDDTARVAPGAASLTVREGELITYTVRLDSRPSAPVRVALAPRDRQITVSPQELTFTAESWAAPQVVTVTAAENFVDGPNTSTGVAYTVTSPDRIYNGLATADTPVTVENDDTAGVTIAPQQLALSEWLTATNHTAVYNVRLTSEPTATVDLVLVDTEQCPVNGFQVCADRTLLTFTPGTWNITQTVRLTAVDDPDDEGGRHTTQVLHGITSADPNYNDATRPYSLSAVTATIEDNDVAAIRLAPLPATVPEGGRVSYSVQLATRPRNPVTVRITTAPTGTLVLSTAAITFTRDDWNRPQTVMLDALSDQIDTPADVRVAIGHTAESADRRYNGRTATATITVLDDDTAGAAIEPLRLALSETPATPNHSGAFTVRLTSQPIAPVRVLLIADAQVRVSPAELLFTSVNYTQTQTVTVTAVDDALDEQSPDDGIVALQAASVDPGYGGRQLGVVTASIEDDDTAAAAVTPPAAVTVAEGSAITYTLRLASQPRGPVTVALAADPAGVVTLTPPTVSFSPADWRTPRTVTVAAPQNFVDESGPATAVTISHSFTSPDLGYNQLHVPDVALTVVDDDMAGVRLSATALAVDELAGALNHTAAYTVRLDSEPTAPVTVTLAFDGVQIAVSPAALVFTPATWGLSQTITVTAVDDLLLEGPQTTQITAAVASADAAYAAMAVPPVTVSIADDDQAGLVVTPPDLSLSENAAGTFPPLGAIQLQLQSPPAGPVTVTLLPDAQVNVAVPAVVFTPASWDTPQSVTVGVVDDLIAEAPVHTGTIAFRLSSPDPYYQDRAVAPYSVQIEDDDPAALIVEAPALEVSGGGAGGFAVNLPLVGRPGPEASGAAAAGEAAPGREGSAEAIAPAAAVALAPRERGRRGRHLRATAGGRFSAMIVRCKPRLPRLPRPVA